MDGSIDIDLGTKKIKAFRSGYANADCDPDGLLGAS